MEFRMWLTWLSIYDPAALIGELVIKGWHVRMMGTREPPDKKSASHIVALAVDGLLWSDDKKAQLPFEKQANNFLDYIIGLIGEKKYYSLIVECNGCISWNNGNLITSDIKPKRPNPLKLIKNNEGEGDVRS